MYKIFLLASTVLCVLQAQAQSPGQIVGITYGDPNQKFTSLDISTKEDSTLATIGNAAIWQGNSTYDKINKRFFGKNGTYIYSIDAETGSLLDSISGLNTFNGIEYNETCDCLVGIYTDLNDNNVYYSSVDFNNKTLNNINSIAPNGSYFGESTHDRFNDRYFRATQYYVETFDNTGTLIDTLPRAYNLSCIEYDPVGDRIIGNFLGVSNSFVIASIDLGTHQLQLLDSIQLSSSVLAGESTFDEVNQRYFFRTMSEIYYYDLQNQVFEVFPNSLPYIGGIEYKAPAVITTNVSELQKKSGTGVFPNPSVGAVFLTDLETGGRIRVFNGVGKCVYDHLIEASTLTLHLEKNNPGYYFYEISGKNRKTGTLIIER